jgi:lysophospholipase
MLGLHLPMSLRTANILSKLFNALGQGAAYCPGGPTPLDDPFPGNRLTHDEARFRRHHDQILAHPELAIGGPTWGWIAFALEATAYLARPENLQRIEIPVVICSAQADKIVVNAAQEAAAAALPDATLVPIPGAFHEILMETDERRALFWAAFDGLAARVAPPRTAPIRLDLPPGRKRASTKPSPPKV